MSDYNDQPVVQIEIEGKLHNVKSLGNGAYCILGEVVTEEEISVAAFEEEKSAVLQAVDVEYKVAIAKSALKKMAAEDYGVLEYYRAVFELKEGEDWPDLAWYKANTVKPLGYLEFMDLFTEAEQVEVESLRETDKKVANFLRKLEQADYVYLDDKRTIAGIAYLKSVLTDFNDAREEQVLNGKSSE